MAGSLLWALRLGRGARLCHTCKLVWGPAIAFGRVDVTDVTGAQGKWGDLDGPKYWGSAARVWRAKQRSVLGACVRSEVEIMILCLDGGICLGRGERSYWGHRAMKKFWSGRTVIRGPLLVVVALKDTAQTHRQEQHQSPRLCNCSRNTRSLSTAPLSSRQGVWALCCAGLKQSCILHHGGIRDSRTSACEWCNPHTG